VTCQTLAMYGSTQHRSGDIAVLVSRCAAVDRLNNRIPQVRSASSAVGRRPRSGASPGYFREWRCTGTATHAKRRALAAASDRLTVSDMVAILNSPRVRRRPATRGRGLEGARVYGGRPHRPDHSASAVWRPASTAPLASLRDGCATLDPAPQRPTAPALSAVRRDTGQAGADTRSRPPFKDGLS
jgi:hypothetical protein